VTFQLTHTHNSHLEAAHHGRPLFTYTYNPTTDPFETPKPHLHPVRTLAGNCVTVYRPHDHLWHHGIAMTFAHVSHGGGRSQNFWGGNCYVHPEGYKRIPELVGRQLHQSWEQLDCDPTGGIRLRHRVSWVSYEGQPWLDETRSLTIADVDDSAGWWALDFASTLKAVAPQPLAIGSPTTHGRPNAGYGGLFWRGPRSFMKGQILAAGGLAGPDTMGQRAPWLAYVGRHDGTDGPAAAVSPQPMRSTMLFIDRPGSLRHPTQWFVRDEPYGCASFAVTFDQELTLQPGDSFDLRHRIVVADGALTPDQIESIVTRP
jgi:hypothetical protein